MHKPATTILCTALFTAVAGCSGGGGSGDSGPDLVTITDANAKTIAGAVLVSSLESDQLSAFTPGAVGSSTPMKPAGSKSTATVYAKVESLKDAETASLLKQSQAGNLQAAVGPVTTPCAVGGTTTVSGNLANEVTLTVGDTLTVSFAACDDGTTVIDGTFSMKITSLSGDLTSGSFALGVAVTLTSFEITENGETVTANGGISFLTDARQSPTVTTTVTTDSLTVSGGGATNTLADFSLTEVLDSVTSDYSLATQGTLTSTAFSGSVTFTTQVNLQGTGADHAVSGELLITGANGATIHIIVLDATNVRLELDLDGNGTVDQTLDATWDELT
jgi:hypothetical protein